MREEHDRLANGLFSVTIWVVCSLKTVAECAVNFKAVSATRLLFTSGCGSRARSQNLIMLHRIRPSAALTRKTLRDLLVMLSAETTLALIPSGTEIPKYFLNFTS